MAFPSRFAGVELGGTKTLALLAEGDHIIERHQIATGSPCETLAAAHACLTGWHSDLPLAGIGIATFGPIRLQRGETDFGHVLPTPKAGWAGTDIYGTLTHGLDCPAAIDTDVNGAALAEYLWGAGKGLDCLWYVTIGTGVGGGLLVDGKPVHGAMHPEIGHASVRRRSGDAFAGICSFHGDCVEGLVSGPALTQRFGAKIETIPDDDPRWRHVAADLAGLVATLLLTTAAKCVLFGGSVATRRGFLLPLVREAALSNLNGYLPYFTPQTATAVVGLAALAEDAGPLGAIALAQSAARAC